ncbi:squalene synthase HpnC [Micromonospora polyrhachis]|uniref:Squalene synthase HpnC n=1 Tax=Micromonospora polyrhachis TaxID=1282883 RepID=A0A7W7SX63_9ACTN|nr:squalene synthase HpnC [Micromonospora polyrhachis]MBB4962635.1 squalene synthase HpnC [Micromonospora polyrhachis]
MTDSVTSPPPDPALDRRDPDTVRAGENFPVALRILPEAIRQHLHALYGYARLVDDIGDEPGHAGVVDSPVSRLARLAELADEVRDMYSGRRPTTPALIRLAPTAAACQLPMEPLLRLITANERDQSVVRYPSFEDLVAYCHLSANPVGELVLHIFDEASPRRVALSDRICTALQIVEHLQDVAEDRRRGRIYLPTDDLVRAGVPEAALDASYASAGLRNVIQQQAERARAELDAGAPLVAELRGWARLAVSGYVAGGRATLRALARCDHDPLPGPPRATRATLVGELLRTLLGRTG